MGMRGCIGIVQSELDALVERRWLMLGGVRSLARARLQGRFRVAG